MSSQIVALFQKVRDGDPGALEELMPQVYDELRRIAQSFMRRQREGHTLQPTALVNEAFIKAFADAQPVFVDRAHFLALMARVMRQVLVDHARALGAVKRGGLERRVPWDTNIEISAPRGGRQLNVLELQDALEALGRESQSLAEVVEMHYFGGMTAEETAVVVGRSVHIVRHDLRLARAWLRRELAR
jgi:RNA polymerase sigma factor (TIGR02999 family)